MFLFFSVQALGNKSNSMETLLMKSNLLLPFPFYLQPPPLRQPLSTALDSSFSAGFEGTSKVLVLYDMVVLCFMIDQLQTFIGSPIQIACAWLAAFQNANSYSLMISSVHFFLHKDPQESNTVLLSFCSPLFPPLPKLALSSSPSLPALGFLSSFCPC